MARAGTTKYALHEKLASYRSDLPNAPYGTPNDERLRIERHSNRKGRVADWVSGAAPVPIIDALVIGELLHDAGVHEALGPVVLYVAAEQSEHLAKNRNHFATYVAVLGLLWEFAEVGRRIALTLLYATPNAAALIFESHPIDAEMAKRTRVALDSVAVDLASSMQRHVWPSYHARFKKVLALGPFWRHAISVAQDHELRFHERSLLVRLLLDQFVRSTASDEEIAEADRLRLDLRSDVATESDFSSEMWRRHALQPLWPAAVAQLKSRGARAVGEAIAELKALQRQLRSDVRDGKRKYLHRAKRYLESASVTSGSPAALAANFILQSRPEAQNQAAQGRTPKEEEPDDEQP